MFGGRNGRRAGRCAEWASDVPPRRHPAGTKLPIPRCPRRRCHGGVTPLRSPAGPDGGRAGGEDNPVASTVARGGLDHWRVIGMPNLTPCAAARGRCCSPPPLSRSKRGRASPRPRPPRTASAFRLTARMVIASPGGWGIARALAARQLVGAGGGGRRFQSSGARASSRLSPTAVSCWPSPAGYADATCWPSSSAASSSSSMASCSCLRMRCRTSAISDCPMICALRNWPV